MALLGGAPDARVARKAAGGRLVGIVPPVRLRVGEAARGKMCRVAFDHAEARDPARMHVVVSAPSGGTLHRALLEADQALAEAVEPLRRSDPRIKLGSAVRTYQSPETGRPPALSVAVGLTSDAEGCVRVSRVSETGGLDDVRAPTFRRHDMVACDAEIHWLVLDEATATLTPRLAARHLIWDEYNANHGRADAREWRKRRRGVKDATRSAWETAMSIDWLANDPPEPRREPGGA